MTASEMLPAAAAFDAVAEGFDARFGAWRSVAAQRRAVRRELARAFPPGARLLEIGGGTGEDAAWLVECGRQVLLTDASPAMVQRAAGKLGLADVKVLAAERIGALAERGLRFDGIFSNFAALNCVTDLAPLGRDLARLIQPGGRAILVLFGTCCPGEMLVEALHGRWDNVLRRCRSGPAPARLSGREFSIAYHRRRDLLRAFSPWFRLVRSKAIGLTVPPSAAEPWISRHPRLLGVLEAVDRPLARPLAFLGDHVLYELQRLAPVAEPA